MLKQKETLALPVGIFLTYVVPTFFFLAETSDKIADFNFRETSKHLVYRLSVRTDADTDQKM